VYVGDGVGGVRAGTARHVVPHAGNSHSHVVAARVAREVELFLDIAGVGDESDARLVGVDRQVKDEVGEERLDRLEARVIDLG